MKRYSYERLEMADPSVRAEYEAAFFNAFVKVTSNRLIQNLWTWDYAANRLATRIPYEHQQIYGYRTESGKLETAMAFNVTLTGFQSEAFGFTPPTDRSGCFEVLTFFTVSDHSLGSKFAFWARCLDELKKVGLKTGFATTARRPLVVYLRAGWRRVDQNEIEGEQRFFLRYEL